MDTIFILQSWYLYHKMYRIEYGNESIAESKINGPNPFTKLYDDRLDISNEDEITAFDSIRDFVEEQLYNAMYEYAEKLSLIKRFSYI